MAQSPWDVLSNVLHTRSKPRSLVLIVIFLSIAFWLATTFQSSLPYLGDYQTNSSPVFNSTLGFAQILAVVLPGSDRRDPLLAAGKAANIDITIFDAIQPGDIAPADTPKNWGKNDYKPAAGVLGCLMSHLTIWRKMINENIPSALIMESDSDFDLRIKQSMLGLSQGSKAIADFPFSPASRIQVPHSPYGDNWDVLWIGHCGANTGGDGRVFNYSDKAAGDAAHVWAPYAKMNKEVHRADGERLVFQLRDVVCTVAYAISNKGAHKMEKRFETVNQPVDLEMMRQCTWDPEMICLATFPQIISMVDALPSNIDGKKSKESLKEPLTSQDPTVGQGIQISARKNAAQGLADRQQDWLKEWE